MTIEEWKRCRAVLQMTQVQLASQIDVMQCNIARKENGQIPISERDALAIECLLRRRKKWPLKDE